MAVPLDVQKVELAFQGRPDLIGAIKNAASAPAWAELFNEISKYVVDLRHTADEPASKKRKLDQAELPINTASGARNGGSNGSAVNGSEKNVASTGPAKDEPVLLEIKEISVVIPQRKKYTLSVTATHIQAVTADTKEPVPGICYAWKDIAYAFCLPVPEKSQKQHNYILFPTHSTIPPSKPTPTTPLPPDPLIFTIQSTPPKPDSLSGTLLPNASAVSDSYKTLLDWLIRRCLSAASNPITLTEPSTKEFISKISDAYSRNRKEHVWCVRCFRGSKDGYLWFLPNGIFWGFKKPVAFVPFERIRAVSYVNVLQRTFNIVVEVEMSKGSTDAPRDGEEEEETEEMEFSMLDQEDYDGIEQYVKRHGLQDASMAEQRKAKREGANVVRNEKGEVVGTEMGGELAKAGMGADEGENGAAGGIGGADFDEEDEEEEDYDPGSEGESEGSGDSTSEEEDGDGDGGGDQDEEEGSDEDE